MKTIVWFRATLFIVSCLVLQGIRYPIYAQQTPEMGTSEMETEDLTDPNELRPLTQADSVFIGCKLEI
jgi:predicted RNA-binding protein with PUA domain